MKKYSSILFVVLAGAFALAGCGNDVPEPVSTPTKGTDAQPVEWLNWQEQSDVKDQIYYVTSMTIVCDNQGIEFAPDAQDMIGAFINDQCRGCAKADMVDDDTAVFTLSVSLLDTDPEAGNMVTYRYYSHNGSKIYTCGPSAFVTDGKYGSINSPYHFEWK